MSLLSYIASNLATVVFLCGCCSEILTTKAGGQLKQANNIGSLKLVTADVPLSQYNSVSSA